LAAAAKTSEPISVCELGGANSSFINPIAVGLNVRHYHVVDLDAYGLSRLEGRPFVCPVTTELSDARVTKGSEQFDIVYRASSSISIPSERLTFCAATLSVAPEARSW